MTIAIGDTLPSMTVTTVTQDGPAETTTDALFKGRTILFAVPGAFTPTCSEQHLPGFVAQADRLADKGITGIVCLAVNDPFVLKAWARQVDPDGRLTMLADGSGLLTKALGLELDLTERGLGVRSQRYAMVIDGLRVTHLAVEASGGAHTVSSADAVLEALG